MIDARSIEAFYWVVKLGGFRRAAEHLATAQPAVSARIAGLEHALGTRLLDRGRGQAVATTPAGLLLLGYAERLLALHAEMEGAFTPEATLSGTVRLGVAETLVHTVLSPLMARLHAAYPRLQLDIQVDVSTGLRAGLLAAELDAALLLGPVAHPGIQDLPLCENPLAWVARPGLVPPGLTPEATLPTLAAWPILTYPRNTRPFHQVRDLLQPHPGARLFANSSIASIVRMMHDGIGIGVIAPAAIQAELHTGTLVILHDAPRLNPLRFTASWREGPGTQPAASVARMAVEVAEDAG